jgi:hypothetical protein
MPSTRLLLMILALSFAPMAQAGWQDSVRPYVEKYLGDDIAIKIFGEKEASYKLPKIPEISKDGTSTAVYDRPEDPNVNLTEGKDVNKYHYKFLLELYGSVKDKKPSTKEKTNWMNALSQGGTREGVYRALVLDRDYGAKEGMEFPLNDSSIKFAMSFFSRFLNRSLTKEQLEKSNFYTLKRVCVERVLEVLEAYILSNRNDLYDWYAIFSGEMAKAYPAAFKSKLRKNPSVEIHRRWATKVPEQFLIGEVIIKLHMLYNQFR